jgi:hypothetical protein
MTITVTAANATATAEALTGYINKPPVALELWGSCSPSGRRAA